MDVFKDIQHDHPTAEGLIPDTRKDLEAIRTFVLDHHIVAGDGFVSLRDRGIAFDRSS